jgi:hypothetical protein
MVAPAVLDGFESWWAELKPGSKLKPKAMLTGYRTLYPDQEYTIYSIVFDGYVFIKDKYGNKCGEWYLGDFNAS